MENNIKNLQNKYNFYIFATKKLNFELTTRSKFTPKTIRRISN